MNRASCNHVNGSCTCTPGWSGVNCTERCPAGYYGMLCASKCQCSVNGTEGASLCNSVTGECNCSLGYHGYRYDIALFLEARLRSRDSVCIKRHIHSYGLPLSTRYNVPLFIRLQTHPLRIHQISIIGIYQISD